MERSLLIDSSEYFAAMLSKNPDWHEAKSQTVHLDQWRRNQIVTIIRCLRTKNPKPILKNMNKFFQAIDYFAITPLLNVCIEHKLARLSTRNVLNEFRFAEFYSIRKLQDECMNFLIANISALLKQPHLNQALSQQLFQAVINHEKLSVANEDAILSLIDSWCAIDGRNSHRVQLLESVHFAHLTLPAFEKCRLDEQCLEVANFRTLIESSRWSDLDETVLSGRVYNQVHTHAVWARNANSSLNVFVSCSADHGKRKNVSNSFSEQYASTMMYRSPVAAFGNQLFFTEPFSREFHLQHQPLDVIGSIFSFRNFLTSEASLSLSFENGLFPVAPPVVIAGDLYIAHVPCEPEEFLHLDRSQRLDPENFGQLEVVRYHLSETDRPPKKTVISSTDIAWCDFSRSLISPDDNKLCVRDDWKVVLVPNEGLLLAIDRRPASGSVIRLPAELWKVENDRRGKFATFSDIVIAEDRAYIALKFKCFRFVRRAGRGRRPGFRGEEIISSVILYDLVQGELLHTVDLSSMFPERITVPGLPNFDLFLREIQNEVYLIGFPRHVMATEDSDIGARGFTSRLQLSADGLQVVSMFENFDIGVMESLHQCDQNLHKWDGRQLSVDAHLCEYATVLQHRAREEEDPVRLEKLRRFTW